MRIKIFVTSDSGVTISDVVSLTLLDNKRCAYVQATENGELHTTVRDIPDHIVAPWEGL